MAAVMRRIGPELGERLHTDVRWGGGTSRTPGSVLIAVAAWLLALIGGGALFVSFAAQYAYIVTVRRQDAASVIEALLLDLLMIVFTLLALGLARTGQSARAERALILLCAAASAYMNVSAADVASPRSVTAYAVAPVALAVVVDRVVAVIRRHVLAEREPSAWATLGHAAVAAARITGLVLLYCLRFALAAPETARGLRRMVLAATPLPALPEAPSPETVEPPCTKKAVLLALYRAHPDYGDRGRASRVAAKLAPQAGLQPGTARSYLYAELDGGKP
jgi:signal transduction histidine kinase